MDSFKLSIAVLLLAGAVTAFYYFADQFLLLRVVGLLAVTGVSAWIALQTDVGQRSLGLVMDAQSTRKPPLLPQSGTPYKNCSLYSVTCYLMFVIWF